MNNLTSLTTFIATRMRRAWRRHCEIIQMTYDLDDTGERAFDKVGAHGRPGRA